MPSGYSTRQAVNEQEVYQALRAATKGYGGVVRFARRVGLTTRYVHGMLDGNRRVSVEVAAKLGFELRWIKKDKREQDDNGQSG